MRDGGSLKQRLAGPEPLWGTWVNRPDPAAVETLGLVGFDVVVVDLEHSELGLHHLPNLLRAAAATPAHALVRTSHLAAAEIAGALDAGAEGVMVPNVASAGEAAALVAAAHYPPAGRRGAAPIVRGAGYGVVPFPSYRERVEDEVVVVAQVEGPEGMAALDEIVAVPGLDVVFVGPFDLSQHLGVPGETDHPKVAAALQEIAAAAAAHGVAAGTWAATPAAGRRWAAAGVRLVTVSSATALFTAAAAELLAELRRD